jgi:sulfate/thiosulfate transport system substrate-binding protein
LSKPIDKRSKMSRVALFSLLVAAFVVPAAGARTTDTTLALVAYSTPKAAFATIIPAFQQTAAGKGVSFTQSYGPSADQANAIVNGLPADIVDLSLAPDVQTLVRAGLVAKSWNANRYKGIVTHSVVVIVVRPGNPKHIRGWNDLIKPGIQVLTPNPVTSGGARWNVLAAYGAQLKLGKTQKQAADYLTKLFHHVPVQDKSARDALNTFLGGKGDALLTYENEALLAQHAGQPVYFNIPKATIRIDNPLAVISKSKNSAAANAFAKFLYTPTAQHLFAESGYRPVVAGAAKGVHYRFPVRAQQFTVDYLGGWTKVQKKFFDPNSGLMTKIEQGLGG